MLSINNMVKIKKTCSFDESKLKYYEEYCKETGRVFSRVIELAVDDYIRNNPK